MSLSSSSFAFVSPLSLASISRSSTALTPSHNKRQCFSRRPAPSRGRSVSWMCAASPDDKGSPDDAEDRSAGDVRRQLESVYESSPSTWPEPPVVENQTLGEIEAAGVARIQAQADELKASLSEVEARMEAFADEEVTKVLDEYEVERASLLSAQAERVELIRGDVLRVKELAESLQSDAMHEDKTDKRLNLLSGLVALFAVGAVSFFVSAIIDESGTQMRYAVADMCIAIGIAVYARWSIGKGEHKDKKKV